jgi:hypothetical protein
MKKNPFKHIGKEEQLPDTHKDKVMLSVDVAKFLMDVTELFTVKQLETNGKFFETLLDDTDKKDLAPKDIG